MTRTAILDNIEHLLARKSFQDAQDFFSFHSRGATAKLINLIRGMGAVDHVKSISRLWNEQTSMSEFEIGSNGHSVRGVVCRHWDGDRIRQELLFFGDEGPQVAAVSTGRLRALSPVETVVQKEVPVEIVVQRMVPVERVTEKIVEVEVPIERIVHRPVEKVIETFVDIEVPVERVVHVMKPVERVVERVVETEIIVEKVIHKVKPVEKIVEVVEEVEIPVQRIVQKVRPVETVIEQYIDVPVERVVEKVRPVENIVERTVDVSVDRIVEKVRPVENIVERYIDVPVERVIERARPVEFITERYTETDGHATLAAAAGVGETIGSKVKADPDDLKIVEGIGPKIEKLFHTKGVYTFEQLAACTPEWIREMLREAGPAYAIHDPATWPRQGRMAAAGDWTDLERWQKELVSGKKV